MKRVLIAISAPFVAFGVAAFVGTMIFFSAFIDITMEIWRKP